MKKMIFMILLGICLISCEENALPAFADAGGFADEIYRKAGLDTVGVYREEVDDDLAFSFGMTEDEFDSLVENAVCLRQTVDSKGRTLYVFETERENDALTLAQKIYSSYEFAPCDAAEKMTVACAGKYAILFKSTASEIDAAAEGFRLLSGGALRFRKDMENHG